MAKYYAQRATAGLIITVGTPVSHNGRGYLWTPGIYTSEQVQGWKGGFYDVHNACELYVAGEGCTSETRIVGVGKARWAGLEIRTAQVLED
jgi:hypothetical protein